MNQLGTKVYMASTKELEDEQVFWNLYHLVSQKRREKIDKLRFMKDKRLSLAAELLLKKALELNGIKEYEMESDENGKPFLAGMASVRFNLSHSDERVMCVVSDQDTGCDVEKMRDSDYKIAKHFFTDEECKMLEEKEGEERKELFFRLWTLKESFMKATGLGMKLSLKDFSFTIKEDQIIVCQKVNREQYYFKEYDLKDGYKYAVCSLSPQFHPMIECKLQ